MLLGVGLGGFMDGILLHQIFQWHHMLSSVLPPDDMADLQVNMAWDGYFHLGVWAATVLGVLLMWSGGRRASTLPPGLWVVGMILLGWGAFNLVEGVVNHHILGIHHVRGWGPDPLWDVGFLATGPVLMVVGWKVARWARQGDRGVVRGL